MYKGYRVCAVVPAGRRRFLEVSLAYLLRDPLIDEIALFLNTSVPDDIAFIEASAASHERVRVLRLPKGEAPAGSASVRFLYPQTDDPNTIYIKCDDDIVFIDDDAVEALLRCRLAHPHAPFISANVVNNSLCYGAQRDARAMPRLRTGRGGRWVVHRYAEQGEVLHRHFLARMEQSRDTSWLHLPDRPTGADRWSINFIAYFGRFIRESAFEVPPLPNGKFDDEDYITRGHPDVSENMICGDAVVAHYAFFLQVKGLDETDVLDHYTQLCAERTAGLPEPA